ncbi:hypothetical protein FKP32DRAFT_614900 [Trametes sanguinea]|nr:hypothetical protein FKP32DRAFT_614900 [Trametes sanguinea]
MHSNAFMQGRFELSISSFPIAFSATSEALCLLGDPCFFEQVVVMVQARNLQASVAHTLQAGCHCGAKSSPFDSERTDGAPSAQADAAAVSLSQLDHVQSMSKPQKPDTTPRREVAKYGDRSHVRRVRHSKAQVGHWRAIRFVVNKPDLDVLPGLRQERTMAETEAWLRSRARRHGWK